MFKTLSALILVEQVASTYSEGPCPSITPVKPFDSARYVGQWYEIYRDQSTPFEKGAKCVTAQYSLRDDGDLNVTNRQSNRSITGKARCAADEGACTVALNK